jgi:hypothetical protein
MYKITKKELVDVINIPILVVSSSLTLYHKVRLSKADKMGNRDYYHKEFSYNSKYREPKSVSTLRLTHSSILTLESKEENSSYQDSLMINVNSRDFIVKCFKLFKKNYLKQEDLIVKINDEEKLNPQYKKGISFEPYEDRVIYLQPILLEDEKKGSTDVFVRLFLNLKRTNLSYVDITEEKFNIMKKIIKKFDFHVSGLAAITYLQSCNIGENVIQFDQIDIRNFDDIEPVNKVKKSDDAMDKLQVTNKSPANKGW